VHKISSTFQPQEPSGNQTHLIVYRDHDYDVRFIEINSVTARLMQLMVNNITHKTGKALLQQITSELNHVHPDVVIQGGAEILNDLKAREIILGVDI
jgi:hypothetical protein